MSMGFSAAIAIGATIAASAAYGAREQRKARKAEEEQTEVERQRLEAEKAAIAAESAAKPMPDPEAQKRGRRRTIADQMRRRRGRQSTMLTGDGGVGDPLG